MALHKMAGHLIRRMNQNSNAIFVKRMQESGYDITPVQFASMLTMKNNPEIEQSQIATHIAYDRATIGGVIDRLEQKGFIQRVVGSRDRRARLCSLTPLGESTLAKVLPVVETLQTEILEGLNKQETEQFLSLAKKVIDFSE